MARAALDQEISGSLFPALNHAIWGDGGLTYPESHPLALARSRKLDAGGTRLTYSLDGRWRWSDGRRLRAADVAFTYRLLADPALGLPLSAAAEKLDSVSTPDDTTVVFHFRTAYPGRLFDTGVGIIPEHVYGRLPGEQLVGLPRFQETGAAGLVVSGPFRLAEWRPADRIVLTRNPDGRVTPRLDRVVIRIIPDEQTRVAELRSGRLDVARITSFREARRLEETQGIRLLRVRQRGFDYVAWNPGGHPAFRDVRVRHALSLGLDRDRILEALEMSRFGEPAGGPYGSLFPDLATSSPDRPAFDPERARRLLEEAGWQDRDGDGVRERDGLVLQFELATTAGDERRESAAQILQDAWAAIGARARIRLEEFGALLDRVIGRRYEAALLGWQVGLDPDISPFWYDPEGPFNVVGYDSPEVRGAIDSARAQPTARLAAPYWRRAGERIAADYPYAFLWFFDLPIAVGPRVRDVEVDVTGFLAGLYRWWIPPELRTTPP
ncbi:MAG: ABC transporter substrate-binding protein [Gemmatimonadota bacterium]